MKTFTEILTEADNSTEGQKIDGLATGKDLYKQNFVYMGFYTADAQKIMDDNNLGPYTIVVYERRSSKTDIRDSEESLNIDMGRYGHGFLDIPSAKKYLSLLKKKAKKSQKSDKRSTYFNEFKVLKVSKLPEEVNKQMKQHPYLMTPSLRYA